MREIKFRTWDEYSKKMIPWGFGDGMFISPSNTTAQSSLQMLQMQYTGLKDKNGVEIYEGDIVKESIRSLDTNSGIETHLYQITWGTEFAGFNVGVAPHWSVLNPHDVRRMEVVGNIYENSELLKDSNA